MIVKEAPTSMLLCKENVLLSLYAKSQNVGKIVTKINRIAYDKVIGQMDIGTVIYPKNITAIGEGAFYFRDE